MGDVLTNLDLGRQERGLFERQSCCDVTIQASPDRATSCPSGS
jgi:hypothetical protein